MNELFHKIFMYDWHFSCSSWKIICVLTPMLRSILGIWFKVRDTFVLVVIGAVFPLLFHSLNRLKFSLNLKRMRLSLMSLIIGYLWGTGKCVMPNEL